MLSCFSHVQLLATLWTVARQPPRHMGFSRQGYWSGLLWPPPGDLPCPGIFPAQGSCLSSPILAGRFFYHQHHLCVWTELPIGLWIPGLFIDKRLHWHQARWGHGTARVLPPPRRAHPPLQEEQDSTSLSSHYAVVGTPSAWMEPKNGPHFQHQPLCNPAISSPWNKVNSPSMTLENPGMFSRVCFARGSRVNTTRGGSNITFIPPRAGGWNLRSRCGQGWLLLRSLWWVCSRPRPPCVFTLSSLCVCLYPDLFLWGPQSYGIRAHTDDLINLHQNSNHSPPQNYLSLSSKNFLTSSQCQRPHSPCFLQNSLRHFYSESVLTTHRLDDLYFPILRITSLIFTEIPVTIHLSKFHHPLITSLMKIPWNTTTLKNPLTSVLTVLLSVQCHNRTLDLTSELPYFC